MNKITKIKILSFKLSIAGVINQFLFKLYKASNMAFIKRLHIKSCKYIISLLPVIESL